MSKYPGVLWPSRSFSLLHGNNEGLWVMGKLASVKELLNETPPKNIGTSGFDAFDQSFGAIAEE